MLCKLIGIIAPKSARKTRLKHATTATQAHALGV
jgi:hypothetical protein